MEICGESLSEIAGTFAEADGLMALHGSHGYLEVAERNGSAARRLQARVGASVNVLLATPLGNLPTRRNPRIRSLRGCHYETYLFTKPSRVAPPQP